MQDANFRSLPAAVGVEGGIQAKTWIGPFERMDEFCACCGIHRSCQILRRVPAYHEGLAQRQAPQQTGQLSRCLDGEIHGRQVGNGPAETRLAKRARLPASEIEP